MKVRIDIDKTLFEEEIIIKCKQINDTVNNIQQKILDITKGAPNIIFVKDNKEYYLEINDILFFEIEDNTCLAHTKDDVYAVKYRLYELEEKLPRYFVRIAKGAIVNINQILALSNSLGSPALIEFNKSYKQVYASRKYVKLLKYRLAERRSL